MNRTRNSSPRPSARSARLLAPTAVLAALLAPALAAAQAEPPAEYQATIAEAVEESTAQNWPEAKALFERAHAMFPNARTLRGLGTVAFGARRYVESAGHFAAALKHPVRPLTSEQRTQVEGLLARSRVYIGHLELDVTPADALISVDGVRPELGPGDAKLALDPGTHQLVVRAKGYREAMRQVLIEGSKTAKVEVELERAQHPVAMRAEAPGEAAGSAEPSMDGGGRLWTWVAGGAALAFGAGAIALHLSAGSDVDAIADSCSKRGGCTLADRDRRLDDRSVGTKETLATVGIVAAATAGVGAVVLFFVEGDDDEDPAVALQVGPAGVGVVGSF